jgi:acetyltransferase-like isoleucine patch superfamily enzyme
MPGVKKSTASRIRSFVQRHLVPRPAVSAFYLLRDGARVSTHAEVELSPLLRFGRGCTVSSFTKIKATWGPLTVGERSGFATGCFVSTGAAGIEIGAHVICGPNVVILGSHYEHGDLDTPFEEQGHSSKGVRIGNNVWIGAGSVVLDGAVIGDNTIVVAQSLVNRRYPPNVIIMGSPARVVMKRGGDAARNDTCDEPSSTSSATPWASSTGS